MLRRIAYYFITRILVVRIFYRKVRFYFYTECWVTSILGHVHVSGRGESIKIGRNATLYPGTYFEINAASELSIGDNFTLSYGSLISCIKSIQIGDFVMIGEYTSIRDSTHNYRETGVPFTLQKDEARSVSIGSNVWIGRGCIIFPGTVIKDNVIIGANSIVKGVVESNAIYAGVPLRVVKNI